MERVTKGNFVAMLIKAVPEFHQVYLVEIEEDKDLPYIVVAYLLSYVLALFSGGLIEEGGPFMRALHFLETANQSGDLDVQDIISCSFLEGVERAGKDYFRFRERLGPTLRRDLYLIDGDNPQLES